MDFLIPIPRLVVDCKDAFNETEYKNNSSIDITYSEHEIIGLGAVSGILLAILIDLFLSFELSFDGSFKSSAAEIFNAKFISRTLLLTSIVLILPIIVVLLILALVYKVICLVLIMNKDKKFISFLDSFDVFWSLEEDSAKSIINVMGIIESHSAEGLATNIKEKLKHIVPKQESEKIFYRRYERYGFYYWRKNSFVDIDEYVEVIEFPKQYLDVTDLENLMSYLEDKPLAYADEGLFKIFITKQRIGDHNEIKGDYGIIFRIHHSIGDGVALIEFLCKAFADNANDCPVNMFSMPKNCNQDSPINLIKMIQKLLEMPMCFVDGILRKPDNNALHGPALNGKKIFKWTESDENLLIMVKDIKENIQQINFTDILITALSYGLQDFLQEKVAPIPDDIAVVLPVRFPKTRTQNNLILKNDFSVTILDVPVKNRNNLNEVRSRCQAQRKSADPITNYNFLKLVCSIFPSTILRPLLNSSQATMVFSNMPGPSTLSISGGNLLKSLVFFVPHKGTTGLGVTALCYGGVLRFAAMADSAIVSSSQELGVILDGMVAEIKGLHKQTVQ